MTADIALSIATSVTMGQMAMPVYTTGFKNDPKFKIAFNISRSSFKKCIDDGSLNIPGMENLPNSTTKLPFFFIGDAAFPLSSSLMKPFPSASRGTKTFGNEERIYNYRYPLSLIIRNSPIS